MGQPPVLRDEQFDAVSTANEDELRKRFDDYRRTLHTWLNALPCFSNLQQVRRKWKRPTSNDAFGTFATDPFHCYSFHHGGRTEAQFNVGLYPTHFRVGLGFEFSMKKGGDPTIVGLVYACFLQVLRARRREFDSLVSDLHLEVEFWSNQQPGLRFVGTKSVTEWLLNPPSEPQWIFVGRLLRRNADKAILEDEACLGIVISAVFTAFRPLWEETQMMAR